MNFDINEVLSDMLTAIKLSVKEDWPIVKETANDYFQGRKERFDLLTSLRLTDQISQFFFELRLKDEKDVLESELHSIAILSKVAAQNAANAAIDVISKAVKIALNI